MQLGNEGQELDRSRFEEWWDRWFDIPRPRQWIPFHRLALLPAVLLRLAVAAAVLAAAGILLLDLETASAIQPFAVTFGLGGLWSLWAATGRLAADDLAEPDEVDLMRSQRSVAQVPEYALVSPARTVLAPLWPPLLGAGFLVALIAVLAAFRVASDGFSVAEAIWHSVAYLVLVVVAGSVVKPRRS